jgi:phosphotriesterase-related protein
LSKQILTVLGPIEPEELGPTTMHEHVLIDLSCNFVTPTEESERTLLDAPVTMDILGVLRRRPFSRCLANVVLDDERLAVEELARFREAGGSGLVDCTVWGIGMDPAAVARIARAAGLHIVQGTGVYVEPSHPEWVQEATIEELAQRFVDEVRVGIGDSGVRAGLLGEIGTSGVSRDAADYARVGDFTPGEEKVLRAAGRASVETGAAVSVHLDVRGQGAFRVIDVLEDEGVAPDRMIMCHLDPVADLDYHLAVAARGVFVEYDCFGREYYSDELGVAWGHDSQRVSWLVSLLEAGYENQILLAQDVCMKIDLRAYGGNGYDHVMTTGLEMLRRAGVGEAKITSMLVENPRRALAFELEP